VTFFALYLAVCFLKIANLFLVIGYTLIKKVFGKTDKSANYDIDLD
jgi:hypothetical protein